MSVPEAEDLLAELVPRLPPMREAVGEYLEKGPEHWDLWQSLSKGEQAAARLAFSLWGAPSEAGDCRLYEHLGAIDHHYQRRVVDAILAALRLDQAADAEDELRDLLERRQGGDVRITPEEPDGPPPAEGGPARPPDGGPDEPYSGP